MHIRNCGDVDDDEEFAHSTACAMYVAGWCFQTQEDVEEEEEVLVRIGDFFESPPLPARLLCSTRVMKSATLKRGNSLARKQFTFCTASQRERSSSLLCSSLDDEDDAMAKNSPIRSTLANFCSKRHDKTSPQNLPPLNTLQVVVALCCNGRVLKVVKEGINNNTFPLGVHNTSLAYICRIALKIDRRVDGTLCGDASSSSVWQHGPFTRFGGIIEMSGGGPIINHQKPGAYNYYTYPSIQQTFNDLNMLRLAGRESGIYSTIPQWTHPGFLQWRRNSRFGAS